MFRLTDPFVMFPFVLAARLIWGVVRPAARAPFGRVILDAVFLTYLISLMKVVLGFTHLGGLERSFSPWMHVNPIPLRTIIEVWSPDSAVGALSQVIGNIVLFVPFGVLLPLVTARFRTFRSVLLAGFLLSVGIEAIQLGLLFGRLMDRAADIDDVILNTVGVVLGYAIWALLFGATSRLRDKAHPAIDAET